MNRLFLSFFVALAALGLTGCTRNYEITLTDGSRIVAPHKPKLQGGSYYYKDVSGQEQTIPQGRVREISPAKNRKVEDNPFKTGPAPTPGR